MGIVLDFFNDVLNTLKENPHIFWVIVGCVGSLVILVALLIVLNAKKKETSDEVTEENSATTVEEQPSSEGTAIEVVEEAPVEDEEPEVVEEAPVVEKKPRKKSSKKKVNKTEEPIEEQPNEIVEETPVEEVATEESVEETPIEVKKPARKRTKKVAAQKAPTAEETLAEEETVAEPTEEVQPEVVEETPVEEVAEQPAEETPTEERTEEAPVEEPVVTKKTRVVNGKYEVYSDGTSFFYTLKASNGEVLIKSEAYASKESVLSAIEAIKRNVEVGTIAVREDKHGLYQFVLTAKNHRTLVMSANYSTEKRATSASESFKRFASTSPVVEIAEIVESTKEEVKVEGVVDKKGGKLGVLSSENGFYYVLKASNGEVLVRSDFYKTEMSAQNAMARFQEAVANGKFFVEKDKRDNYQFKLFGSSGRIVCVGQIYATKAMAIASVNSVVSFVKLATVIEE